MLQFLIYVLLISVTVVRGQGKQCAKDGEYCLTHSDCCSRSCLSFSYKCVPNYQGPSVSSVYVPPQVQQQSGTGQTTGFANRFEGGEQKCAKDGEYCQTHSDCCSRSCLSFSYKCVPVNQGPTSSPPRRPQQTNPPTSSTDRIPPISSNFINRFDNNNNNQSSSSPRPTSSITTSQEQQPQCAKDGEYCLTHSECCSRSCLSFAYKCVPLSQQATTSFVYVPPQPSTQNPDIINRFEGDDSTASTSSTTPRQCAKDGEYCLTSFECCSRSCLSFSYKCVPTHQNIFSQNFPFLSVAQPSTFENRFGNNNDKNGNCLTNGNACSYAEQCCSRGCYKNKCATEIQIGISETELLKPSAVNGPVVFVNSLDDLLDQFEKKEKRKNNTK